MTTRGSPVDSRPRHSVAPEGEQTWMDQENSACHFRDKRLKRRFRLLLEQFGKYMGQSITFACQDWASTKAAYRFLPTTTSVRRTY
ncbi:MAG: transposase DNA-binding-containing protein [Sphingomonadaceae bacterium]